MSMEESDRVEGGTPPSEPLSENAQPQPPQQPAGGDDSFRRRRRGRRGRGGGGGGYAGPRPPYQGPGRPPFAGQGRPPYQGGQQFRGPAPAREDSEQSRELAAYERRTRRPIGGQPWRPGGGAGRPAGAGWRGPLEAMRAGRGIRRLYVSQDRSTRTGPVNELITEAQTRRIFVRYVDKLEIARLSPIENHQGVVAIVQGKTGVELDELLLHLDTLSDPALVLVVDSLQDPQNFGVLLRSAEGAGVDGVVIPHHRSVGLTPAVAKTSSGASEHLLIADVANLRQAIDALKEKGIWVVAADETGDLLYDEVDYRGPTALVIGGEGEGIRRLVLEGADQVVRLPMEGQVASLNASAAGTVLLYEALRQLRRDVAPPDTRTPRPAPRAVDGDASPDESAAGAAEPELASPPDDLEGTAQIEQAEAPADEHQAEQADAPAPAPAPKKPKTTRKRSTKKPSE
ncbi:MAG: 23S rRNA (guanosine(2251)-2'-O)-methyltransferase RlmB [Chloroflexi bacterium]|nr:MAG: 23S rRNA (guanosine(2251)-2'-O)-methyltransferase RlmB [Chloroflexota bacterium]